jgi:hypothetical protein
MLDKLVYAVAKAAVKNERWKPIEAVVYDTVHVFRDIKFF